MKHSLVMYALMLLLFSCNEKSKDGDDKKMDDKKSNSGDVNFVYKATYSSSFEIGDWKLASNAIQASWKDWETNTFDHLSGFFADTVTALYGDGEVFSGPKDTLIAKWKEYRGKLTNVVDSVHAWVPLYSKDKEENWVLIWATEYSTNDKGVKDSVSLQETWRFNKDGKADRLLQYQRKTKPAK